MKIRQKFDKRSVPAGAVQILFWCLSVATPFAQLPSAPTNLHASAATFPKLSAAVDASFTYKIIDAPQHTYGYDVFAAGRLIIHQTSVPGLQGNEGFKTKEDATTVALLVIEKIRKGEMPPTISIDEMKKLNVIN